MNYKQLRTSGLLAVGFCLALLMGRKPIGDLLLATSAHVYFAGGVPLIQASTSKPKVCKAVGENIICQYGVITSRSKYAIYGCSFFDEPRSVNYCFDLPLSALAWKRIGFSSIVYILGEYDQCKNDSKIQFTSEMLMNQDDVVLLVFQGFNGNNAVTLSQVLRLFPASFVQRVDDIKAFQETYIITADADIWPVDDRFFDLPPGKEILYGDLSGDPVPDVNKPTKAPLSYVGMRVRTWVEVMSNFGLLSLPNTTNQLIRYFAARYGKSCCVRVKHGGRGWGMDQMMINTRIDQWKHKTKNGKKKIYIYKRTFIRDRIDRARWKTKSLRGIVDAHILKDAYKVATWKKMRPLISMLYRDRVTVSACNKYTYKIQNRKFYCR